MLNGKKERLTCVRLMIIERVAAAAADAAIVLTSDSGQGVSRDSVIETMAVAAAVLFRPDAQLTATASVVQVKGSGSDSFLGSRRLQPGRATTGWSGPDSSRTMGRGRQRREIGCRMQLWPMMRTTTTVMMAVMMFPAARMMMLTMGMSR